MRIPYVISNFQQQKTVLVYLNIVLALFFLQVFGQNKFALIEKQMQIR